MKDLIPIFILVSGLAIAIGTGPALGPRVSVSLEPGAPSWVRLSLSAPTVFRVDVAGPDQSTLRLLVVDPTSRVILNSTFVGKKSFVLPVEVSGVHQFGLLLTSVGMEVQVLIDYEPIQASAGERVPLTVLALLMIVVMISLSMFAYIVTRSPRGWPLCIVVTSFEKIGLYC